MTDWCNGRVAEWLVRVLRRCKNLYLCLFPALLRSRYFITIFNRSKTIRLKFCCQPRSVPPFAWSIFNCIYKLLIDEISLKNVKVKLQLRARVIPELKTVLTNHFKLKSCFSCVKFRYAVSQRCNKIRLQLKPLTNYSSFWI